MRVERWRMTVFALLGAMLWCGPVAWASDAGPSAEFWQYMLDFSDANGQLIDPQELAMLAQREAAVPATTVSDKDMNKRGDAQEIGETEQ